MGTPLQEITCLDRRTLQRRQGADRREPMSDCGAHSGVCTNIENIKERIDCIQDKQKTLRDDVIPTLLQNVESRIPWRIFLWSMAFLILGLCSAFTWNVKLNDRMHDISKEVRTEMSSMREDLAVIKSALGVKK